MSDYTTILAATNAEDIEKAVLGALLVENDSYVKVANTLTVDSFYSHPHKAVYKSIVDLWEENNPVDILTVTNKLKEQKLLDQCGGAFGISNLTNGVGSAANIEYHSMILKQKEITRRQVLLSIEVMNAVQAEDYDPLEANELITRLAYECNNVSNLKQQRSLTEIAIGLTKRLDASKDKDITGIPSGHSEVDKRFGGWQSPDLIVLAARPGMGKTALMLSWAAFAAIEHNIPCVIFSLEMTDEQLMSRLIGAYAGISSSTLRTGKLSKAEWDRYHAAVGKIERSPLTIIDNCFDIREIEAKANELRMKGEMDLMCVDYLQLITVQSNKNSIREQEISKITRTLKLTAKRIEVPVIALSQLSRAVESRGGDKRPNLSDLRESGAIEQDADIVGFLYRPEYYKIDKTSDGISTNGLAIVTIGKNRHGGLDDILLCFVNYLMKFTDYEIPQDETDEALDGGEESF